MHRYRHTIALVVVLLACAAVITHGIIRDHDCTQRGGVPTRNGCAARLP